MLTHASNYDLTRDDERSRSNRDLEELFFGLLELIEPDVFVEIGAFFAEASQRARSVLPNARVVAFEANPYNFKMCSDRLDFVGLRIDYVHSAVADVAGDVTFRVHKISDGEFTNRTTGRSSIYSSNNPHREHEIVTVPATTLDRHFDPIPRSVVLWIDVEGASELVLKGGQALFRSVEMVFIEVEDREFWDGQWLSTDVGDFLALHGFLPAARDFESTSRFQYNMVFVKRRWLENFVARSMLISFFSSAARGRDEDRPGSSGP